MRRRRTADRCPHGRAHLAQGGRRAGQCAPVRFVAPAIDAKATSPTRPPGIASRTSAATAPAAASPGVRGRGRRSGAHLLSSFLETRCARSAGTGRRGRRSSWRKRSLRAGAHSSAAPVPRTTRGPARRGFASTATGAQRSRVRTPRGAAPVPVALSDLAADPDVARPVRGLIRDTTVGRDGGVEHDSVSVEKLTRTSWSSIGVTRSRVKPTSARCSRMEASSSAARTSPGRPTAAPANRSSR